MKTGERGTNINRREQEEEKGEDGKMILRLIQVLNCLIREDKKHNKYDHKTDIKTDISISSY